MELIAEGSDNFMQGSELLPFRTVFRRHTPFSIENVEQVFQNSTVEFSRGGDLLLYAYLYIDNTFQTAVDWNSVVSKVEFLIGEQVIDSWPIEYIIDYHPILMCPQQSRYSYVGDFFLPLPLPIIPVCALRYNSMKIKITGTRQVKCSGCYAYLSNDDRLFFKDFDMMIHQLQKKNIASDGTICLSNPVKFIFSSDITSDKIVINDTEIDTPLVQVSSMYNSRFTINNNFYENRSYLYVDYSSILGMDKILIRTTQVVNGNVFLFSATSNPSKIIIYDMKKPFNSNTSYKVKTIPTFVDFTTSSYDGLSNLYAAGYTIKSICKFNILTGDSVTATIPSAVGNVFSILQSTTPNNSNLYIVGDSRIAVFDNKLQFTQQNLNLASIKNYRVPITPTTFVYNHAVLTNFRTMSIFATYSLSGLTVTELKPQKVATYEILDLDPLTNEFRTFGTQPTNVEITSLNTQLGLLFSNYSANVVVGNYNYLAPSRPDKFFGRSILGKTTIDSEYPLLTNEGYSTISYDGNRYLYMFPVLTGTIVRFNTNLDFSFFHSFCTDCQSMYSSGFLNFSRAKLRIPGKNSGTVYAVNYNILRFRQGMASILYAV